uniref:Transducin-like enhancer protein 4 n=1 Tax=Castor canadensis TaxID=51338 RepID=A0A8B7VYS1_CASCN|nr:transducin-like enhancer protein 4 [Castor canadensis]
MIRDLSKMYPQTRHPAPHQPAQPFKFTISESCDRIKEEFQFLQAQYHSLKLECEKLASEKTEMQRHYVMYYEMSYGLNIEMHKQVSYYFFNYHFKCQKYSCTLKKNGYFAVVFSALLSVFLKTGYRELVFHLLIKITLFLII